MKKKFWLWGIVILLIVIQLIPYEKPAVIENNPDDLLLNEQVPENVAQILKRSCYDCHSNQTVYPWYAYVAPVSWLVRRDVKLGRKEVNFSEWNKLKPSKKAKALDDIAEYAESGEMPMPVYTIMHKDAKMTPEQRKAVIDWANQTADNLFGDD